MKKKRIVLLICILFLAIGLLQGAVTVKASDNTYDLNRYTIPYWEGDTVYHESVMVRKEKDGSILPISLLYPAAEIVSVQSSDLKTVYQKGIDWDIQNGKLIILEGSAVPFMTYEEYYPSVASSNSFETVNGGNIYFSEGTVLHKKQIAVTYKHTASWKGSIPKSKGHLMPKTLAKLKNNESLKILFYGDSITTGANSSGAFGVAPYAQTWMDMFTRSLEKTYNNHKITTVNTAVGGKTSSWGASNAKERVAAHKPDLLVVGFGMNDGKLSSIQHKDNINTIIRAAKEANPNVEVLIVSTMLPNPEVKMSVGNQALYESELLKLETEGVVVAPVTSMHKYLMEHKRYSDMTGNNVNHPNDFIARLYAQTLIATMEAEVSDTETSIPSTETDRPGTEIGSPGTEAGTPGTEDKTPDAGTHTPSVDTGASGAESSKPDTGSNHLDMETTVPGTTGGVTNTPDMGMQTPVTGPGTQGTGTGAFDEKIPSTEHSDVSIESDQNTEQNASQEKPKKDIQTDGIIFMTIIVLAAVILIGGCVGILRFRKKK